MMIAALSGRLDLVKKLRARGAEIDGPGWTPLIYAATGGRDDVVRYLLTEGADINAASPNGTTALMMAAREGKGSTVELLVARGADVNRRNQSGVSALDSRDARRSRRWSNGCSAPERARRQSGLRVGFGRVRAAALPTASLTSVGRRLGSTPASRRAPLNRRCQNPESSVATSTSRPRRGACTNWLSPR